MSETGSKPEDLYDNEATNVHLSSSNKNEKCDVSTELLSYRDIMLKNQVDLKKKEEEVQEYANKLSKIKSKVKSSRHSVESTSKVDDSDDSILDISDPKTPSEKGLLLKKKLEENRKIFELRNKELNESKRAAEVQVEKIRQQLNDSSTASSTDPLVTSIDDKDKKINELNSKIIELESIIIDLKDSLSNKDSVIESKTKAITLVTDNLSLKSKVTLDKLEDTKDEMRNMQENFVQIEEALKSKVKSLLSQIQERDLNISEFENKLKNISLENEQLKSQCDHLNLMIDGKDKQVAELEEKFKLEENLHNVISEKDNHISQLQHDIQELNHNMIKLKAHNKSKLKNLQKRLDSYYKTSNPNDEEVNFVNQVAVLEEEIGNLQLNLVDFDEIKVVNEDLKKQITELNDQLASKTAEVESYNTAIVTLENQKLELIQELHEVKQEVLALESENADCENQRVTAELKVVELEEKLELLHKQDYNKDTINDVTQENFELIRVLNQLQNQVNVALNERSLLEEKFNKLTICLNHSNETLTNLKSEIINLKQWNDDQYTVIQGVLTDLDENQLESTQKNKLLSYHRAYSENNNNVQSKLTDTINSVDILKYEYEQLINNKIEWNDKLFFRDIKTSDIEALGSLNIVNLLTDNNPIIDKSNNRVQNLTITEKLNSKYDEDIDKLYQMIDSLNNDFSHLYNQLNIGHEVIENLMEKFDLDKKHVNNSKNIINQLSIQLQTSDSEDSNSDKFLINELTDEFDSLLSNMAEKQNSLTSILSDKSLKNLELTSDKKLKIIDLIKEQLKIVDSKIKQKNELIMSMEEKNKLNVSEENTNVYENNSLKMDKLTKEINNLKQNITEYEKKMMLLMSAKDMLENQLEICDEKLSSNDDLESRVKELSSEVEDKKGLIKAMSEDKPLFENQLKQKEEMNQKHLLRIEELINEVTEAKQQLANLERNLTLISGDKEVLEDELKLGDSKLRSVDKLHDEIKQLGSEVEEKEKIIESMVKEKEQLENLLKEKVQFNEDCVLRINELSGEMVELEEKIAEHGRNFSLVLNDKEALKDEIRIRNDELKSMDELYVQNDQLVSKVGDQESTIKSLSDEKATLENQIKEKEVLSEDSILKVNELLNEMTVLKQKIREHELNFTLIMSDKNMLEDEVKFKNEKLQSLTELHNKNDELKSEIKDKDEAIKSLLEEKVILESQLGEKEELNRQNIIRIDELFNEIKFLKQQIEESERNFLLASMDKGQLEDEIKLKNDELKLMEELQNKIKQLNAEIENKIKIINSTSQEKLDLENELKQNQIMHQKEIEMLEQDVVMHKQEIDDNVRSINKLQDDLVDYESEMMSILDEKTLLETKLSDAHHAEKINMRKINKLIDNITDLKEALAFDKKNFTLVLNDKEMLEKHIREQEEKLQSMNEVYTQNEILRNEIEDKVGIIESMKKEKVVLENQLKELVKMNEDNALKNNDLFNEISSLNKKLIEYEQQYTFILNDKQALENEIKIRNEQLTSMDNIKEQILKLNEELNNKEKIMESILNDKTTLENQLREREHSNQDSILKIIQLSNEIASLNQRLAEYDEHFTLILNDKQILVDQIKMKDENLAAMNELNEQFEQLTNAIGNKETLIESLSQEKNLLENQLRQSEELNQDNGMKINELTNVITEHCKKEDDYQEQIRIKDEKLNSINELYGKIEELQKQVEYKQSIMESILKEKDLLESQLREKEQLHQDSLIRINELSNELDILHQQMTEREQNFMITLNNKEMLEDQIKMKDEKLKSVEELHHRIQQLSIEKEELHENNVLRVNALFSEVNVLKSQLEEYERNLAAISSDKEILESEIVAKNEKIKLINDLNDQSKHLSDELMHETNIIDALFTEKTALESELTETVKLYQDSKVQLNESINEIMVLRHKITEHEENIVKIFSEKEILESQIKNKNDLSKDIEDKEMLILEMLKEKKILVDQLDENKRFNQSNAAKMDELRKEIDDVRAEMSKRDLNITSLLDNMMVLEQELKKAKDQWSGNQEKLEIIEKLNSQFENQIDYLSKIKSEIELSHTVLNESRVKCMESLHEINAELENIVEDAATKQDTLLVESTKDQVDDNVRKNVTSEDKNKVSWLEQELEAVKKHNSNQMQKMRIIAANLKKKSAQCQEFETSIKEFKEKWENEVSEKKELFIKLEKLELEINDKDKIIAEFDELSKKRENELQYLKEKVEALESDINDRVVQFNNVREKIIIELEKCKKEQLMDENLKDIYRKILELGAQVKEMELKNVSDLNSVRMLKSQSKGLFSDEYLNEFEESTGIDYNNKHKMFEFIASRLMEDGGINEKDLKSIISRMAEKYVIIEGLKLKNKKLMKMIDLFHSENQVCNESSSQVAEPLKTEHKEESVNEESDVLPGEKIDPVGSVEKSESELTEQANQPPINLDEEEVWGWNEDNSGASEFKMTPICTPETQMQIKIAELEDKFNDLQDKKSIVDEELKVIMLKNKKLIKKLQEFKIQNYNLQQQLKLQSNSSKFGDLDYTIEEELKNQITQLEKNLNQLKEDNQKISTERDTLLNRIEILTATKDELNKTMAMKNNELMMQIQHMDQNLQSIDNSDKFVFSKSSESEEIDKKKYLEYEEKISKLEESLIELLTENNELKALTDTYEIELNTKKQEIEKLSNQTEYSKLNFFNMLEESHNEKKECLDNLSDAFENVDNISISHQSNLEKERLENNELKKSIASLREIEQQMNMKLANLAEELQSKNNEIEQVKINLENIELLLNTEMMKKNQLEQEYDEIKNKLNIKNEEFDSMILTNEKNINETNLEIQLLRNHQENLTQELQIKNEEIINLNSNCENLKYNFDEEFKKNNQVQLRYEEILNELSSKTREFNEVVEEKDMKIESLEKSLKETLESLFNKPEELKNMETSVEDKLKSYQDLSKEAASEQVSELQTFQLQESESGIERVHLPEENLEKSTKEQENYSKSYDDLQRKLSEVNESMTNVTDLLNIRVQEVADLKQYIKKLEFDKMAVDNTNHELNSINVKLSDKNRDIMQHLDKLKKEFDEKIQVILSLETKVIELQALHDGAISDLNNQTLEVKSLKEIINNNEVLIQSLESIISDRDERATNLEGELVDYHNKIQELSTTVSDLQNSMVLPENLDEKIQEIERLEKIIETMKEEHRVLIDEYEKKMSENTIALNEMKSNLSLKSEEVEDLKYILNDNTYPGIIQELQNKIDHLYEERHQLKLSMGGNIDELSSQVNRNKNNSANDDDSSQIKDSNASELDVALYMLHQRDVRCEELTHELLQLLEERDTLQLRLSNAIKINEELKKYTPCSSKILSDDLDGGSSGETASSSPTIAKSIEPKEDMDMLNQKLSQLHNVDYHRDIRLIDERESRHMQQMSVIPHKSTLSPLSSDAAAKIIDANYTVSRDVQSQSNVLLNWFWGKSTPKVTHM